MLNDKTFYSLFEADVTAFETKQIIIHSSKVHFMASNICRFLENYDKIVTEMFRKTKIY